ncbi:glutathione S-transferase [Rhizobium sp. Root149]|uniref:Glutathione S-transferase n=1 Tax=Rhizobium rhizoryzae TaxID=451876 RepID=A0A7W6LDY5_9HYPH|nr:MULTISPECIES: glutathione S-transferase family protein [Rhizobium]KQZ62965.1 glutathione S-transferase [Rhizobium sp. Root149]MBB4142563.1 glutathione S-transferase [Rhizobium rhizoryzae]
MKLLVSPASPYSAKCRMAARHLALGVEEVRVDTNAEPPELIDNNPLGKIPVLLRDGQKPVYDSVAIMQFFNRQSGGKLYPAEAQARTDAEVLEALADGITDCLLAIIYERRFRPEDKVEQSWIDKQWSKVTRGLDYLEANLPVVGDTLHGGHFALAALIGYLDLRFAGKWANGRPKLAAWPDQFSKLFPEFATVKPAA